MCMDLVTHHKKRYKCTHYTPVLREIFCLPCWLTLSCKLMIGTFNVGSPSCIFGGTSDYIFLVRLVLPQSMTSLDVHFSMLFNQGFGMPCGTFWVVTCYRNLSDRIAKFSFFSLRAVLRLNLQCVASLSPQRNTSFIPLYFPIYYDNKPASFTPEKCGWILEY